MVAVGMIAFVNTFSDGRNKEIFFVAAHSWQNWIPYCD